MSDHIEKARPRRPVAMASYQGIAEILRDRERLRVTVLATLPANAAEPLTYTKPDKTD